MNIDITITYGPLRLRMAQWAGKDPADITMEDIAAYENYCQAEGIEP